MTLAEALDQVRQAGATLVLDEQGPALRGRVPLPVVDALRENRDRVAAVLRLGEFHQAMGFNPEDVAFIEAALLSGRVGEIRIVARPPSDAVA